jgi:DNA-binding CsgD family transcriptional regulator
VHVVGVVLVGPNQRILALNSVAEQILGRGCSFLVEGEVLQLALPPDGRMVRVERPSGRAPLVAWATLLQGTGSGPSYRAVTLVESERRLVVEREALGTLFRFTRAELRLAEQLIAGMTPSEAAKELGVTIHTVRTYLKRLYQKVGVKTQAGLLLALLSRAAAFTVALPPGD